MTQSLLRILVAATVCTTLFAQEPAAPAAPAPATAPGASEKPVAPPQAKPASPARPQITFTNCNVSEPCIAITFDDGPSATETPRLLEMLKKRGIKATFYCVGQNVAAYPEIARRIVAEGHEIASHSWSHPLLSKMKEGSVTDQLQRTHEVIQQTTGIAPATFRPPYGGFTTNQRAWANYKWGYKTILWDVDSLDWKHRTPAKTHAIIISETRPGSIILVHDIHKTSVDAMPQTLDDLTAKGFKFVTVSQLLDMHRPGASAPKAKPETVAPAAAAAATGETKITPKTTPSSPAAKKKTGQ